MIEKDLSVEPGSQPETRQAPAPHDATKKHLLDDLLPVLWASMEDAVHVINDQGRFVLASPSLCRLLGYTEQEIIGQSFEKIVPPELQKISLQRFQNALIDRDSGHVGEFELMSKDGRRLFVNVRYTRLDVDGQRYHAFTVRDMTEQKAIEQHLLHADRIWTLGTLAGGVAHEFNNILVSILGYADMIAAHHSPSIYQVRRFARKIKRAAKRGTQITGQLLPFARREEDLRAPVDVHKLLKEVVDLFLISAGKRLHVQLDLLAANRWVQANNILLQQVMLNLLLNAQDAMEGQGQMRLETENVAQPQEVESDDTAAPFGFIEIRVIDDGCGMSEAVLRRIFEPFFTTKESGKGTGLGMALVYSTVAGIGGDLHVVSRQGQGTTVYIYLPCIEPPTRVEPPQRTKP